MAVSKITIPLDTDTARIYAQAPSDVQAKLRLLLSLWLREYAVRPRPLQAIMDEISKKAQAHGMTSEILESLLHAS